MRRTVVALSLVLTSCTAPAAPVATPVPVVPVPPVVPVREEAARLVGAGARGAVVLVRDGDQVWQAAAGVAELGVPMRPEHRFRIASITKTFTATLVMRQVAQGRLALDDRVDRLLPGVIKTKATVADLLRHTSGVSDYLTDERFDRVLRQGAHLRHWTPQQILKYADKRDAPGYSNSNYILLGMILEKVARKPYRQLLSEHLTRPLSLNATELPVDDLPADLAHGMHTDGQDRAEMDSSIFWSAGGLVSTAADVAAFYRWLFAREEGRKLRADGFGIFTETYCGQGVSTHSGMIHGYGGVAMSSQDGNRVVVVQLNSTRPGDAIAAAARLMCGR